MSMQHRCRYVRKKGKAFFQQSPAIIEDRAEELIQKYEFLFKTSYVIAWSRPLTSTRVCGLTNQVVQFGVCNRVRRREVIDQERVNIRRLRSHRVPLPLDVGVLTSLSLWERAGERDLRSPKTLPLFPLPKRKGMKRHHPLPLGEVEVGLPGFQSWDRQKMSDTL